MPQELRNLEIQEVSLVTSPANASTDPITGRKTPRAVVAIWKLDTGGDYLSPAELREHMDELESERKLKQEKKRMSLKSILKSGGSGATREEICAAVAKRAMKIAKAQGTAVTGAVYADAWTPELYQAYEVAPIEVTKAEPRMMRITKSEIELDKRARRLMKANPGMTFAKSCATALEQDPSLYAAYEKDLLDPSCQIIVPDAGSQGSTSPMGKAAGDDDNDDDEDGEDVGLCAKCTRKLRKGDKFCGTCGSDVTKARSRKRSA